MRHAIVALLALAACKTPLPTLVRASDGGWTYDEAPDRDAMVLPVEDAGTPSLTLVGGAPGGRGDLDGIGDGARLGLVSGMVRVGDAIVFADMGNGSIRRFVPATGAVDTLVVLPHAKESRPALPAFIAYDGKRLYVTDRTRQVVYALDPGSRALSVAFGKPDVRGDADGVSEHAVFDTPTGIAFDGAHALYVADTGSRAIRRIDLATSQVSTLTRGLMQPWGVCFSRGELFVAENLASSLLRVDLASGATTSIAGSNRFGYAAPKDGKATFARLGEPRGIACTDDTFYLADRGGGLVRAIRRDDGYVTSLAGRNGVFGVLDGKKASALFGDPQSVLVWDATTLYVGDEATMRRVSTDGVVQTVAGNGVETLYPPFRQGSLNDPGGVTVVPSEGAAFVANCRSSSIERVDLRNGEVTTFVGNQAIAGFVDGAEHGAHFLCAQSIAYDGAGNLFVGDHGNHAIRGVHVASHNVLTVAGSPTRCANDDGPVASATFCDPAGLAALPGTLFVADAATQTIRRIDLALGRVSTLAGAPFERGNVDATGTAARFSNPRGIAYVDGVLYLADEQNGSIRRIDATTGAVSTIATGLDEPRAIASIGKDELLIADRSTMMRLSLSTRVRTRIIDAGHGLRVGNEPSLSFVSGLAGLFPGDALVLDENENVLLRLRY